MKRITKKQVEEAGAKLQRRRQNYSRNDLTVVRAEIAYQEIKDAYAAQQSAKEKRSAFTILELLVVITIIAILMAISLKVFGAVVSTARESATRSTLSKIQGLMDARAQAFDRRFDTRHTYMTSQSVQHRVAAAAFPGDVQATNIATRKLLEATWFPQSAAELVAPGFGFVGNPPVTAYMAALYPKLVSQNGLLVDSATTSEEVYYDFLTQEASLGNSPVGTDQFSSSEVSDVRGAGLPVFIDAWGHPIRFYRWPTRLFRPQGQTSGFTAPLLTAADLANAKLIIATLPGNTLMNDGATDLGRDPDDPLRTLWAATNGVGLENIMFPGTSISGSTPSTWWTFMAVSAGPDGVFGMHAPDDVAHLGNLGAVHSQQDLTDDIISISMKTGGLR